MKSSKSLISKQDLAIAKPILTTQEKALRWYAKNINSQALQAERAYDINEICKIMENKTLNPMEIVMQLDLIYFRLFEKHLKKSFTKPKRISK